MNKNLRWCVCNEKYGHKLGWSWLTKTLGRKSLTFPNSMQWAAVRTQTSEMRDPPQKCSSPSWSDTTLKFGITGIFAFFDCSGRSQAFLFYVSLQLVVKTSRSLLTKGTRSPRSPSHQWSSAACPRWSSARRPGSNPASDFPGFWVCRTTSGPWTKGCTSHLETCPG